MKKTKYSGKLYFLSEKKLDSNNILPKVPDNYFTQSGYEDNKVKRVCLCKSIDKCLMALSKNCKDLVFNVYVIDDAYNYEIFTPSVIDVPDSIVTEELWILSKVKARYNGKIKCTGVIPNNGYEYSYGTKTARLYDWKYEWINCRIKNGDKDV